MKGEAGGVIVVDDYGHHPTEIAATIQGALSSYRRRVFVLFQPHRYTRTRDVAAEFAGCFDGAHKVFIADIYPAGEKPIPYHGYYYRILTKQGPGAPGGAYDYLVKGKLKGGFALIAVPAEYGNSGIMTFMVNQQGRIYEKDLGENTAIEAAAIQEYDLDSSWKLTKDEEE